MQVGLIGVGRIGSLHARTLKESAEVSRLTITDVDRKRAAGKATELDAELADSPQDVISAGVEALVIAAATPAHAELLHLAADAGVPAFCEKPIALDLNATDGVVEHVKRLGVLVQIGFQRRFDAGYRAARQAVDSGALGDVRLIRMATHDPAPPPPDYIAGSGGLWRDLAIHDFDIAPWVLGRAVTEVYADGEANESVFAEHRDVDAAGALLRFAGGAVGAFSAARNDPRGYDVRMEIFGMRDSVAVGWDDRTPLRSIEPAMPAPSKPGYRNFIDRFALAYRAELEGFLNAVKSGLESPCTVDDARRALVVAIAAERSLREHRPVRVEEVG
jgi:myo-inositol 2-dehydrogenase / D-chiro-inositol 1-dehydrogenase